MSSNTIGKNFQVTNFGESHGKAIGCVIDGCPPNLTISEDYIQKFLDLRKPGTSRHTTQRREDDKVEILSGIFEGKTTGTPIALLIKNIDQRSKDYSSIAEKFRPGHADYTYYKKYGIRDYRGGGRSSARETASRVAAGSIARKLLKERFNIEIQGYLSQLGDIKLKDDDLTQVYQNPFFTAQKDKISELEKYMDELRKSGDSIGAKINVIAKNVPVGLGEPVFDRLDADIAHSMMSINATKGVEIGSGFDSINQKGSLHRDVMTKKGFLSNNAGGILGGISTGQDILVSVAFKPTSSLRIPTQSLDINGDECEVVTLGRHDPCVGIRATPIVESMLAITLVDHCLRNIAQNYLVE